MRMASGCGAQSVAERRVSSLNASPSSASQPKLRGLRSSARVNAAAGSRLRAVEPAQSNGVTSNGRRPQAGPKQKNGSRPTIPAIVTPLGPAEMDEEVSHKAPDRYGWPDRSDMYILRTDGNVCARTLVKGTGRLQLAYPSSHQYMMVWKQKPKTVMIIKKLGEELTPQLLKVATYLSKQNVNVVLEPDVHQSLAEQGFFMEAYTYTPDQAKRLGDFIDFVICLGGDGVLLHTAQTFKENVPPIVAFHLGSLGFLSQHSYTNFENDIQDVIDGHEPLANCKVNNTSENQLGVYVSLRMRLKCEIKRAGKLGFEQTHEVLNEVVLDRGSSSFLTNINVYESGNFMTCVQADGVMIATPTGSTAYSAAAGGSMVHPNVPAILFTPICAHSLNFRPIVLPDYSVLEMRVSDGSRASVWVSFDGKHRQELHEGDMMRVRMSPNPVATINRLDQTQDWMHSLDRCFGWSKRISQKPLPED